MPEKEVTNINRDSFVRQSNEIIEANYKLTIAEQKIMLCFIANIDTTKSNFEVSKISAKSLSDACGFNPKSGYRQLQLILKKLLGRSIILQGRDGSGWYGSHWVQSCDYVQSKRGEDRLSYVQYELDSRLCPHFLQLRERFLKSDLKSLVSFSHIYSVRFYMIFKNRLKIGHARYTFADLIKLFELPKSYEVSTTNLKNKIIKISIDEINEKSNITVEYTYYKGNGRKHIGVDFEFHVKAGYSEVPPPISAYPSKKTDLQAEEKAMLEKLTNPDKWNVAEDIALKMLKKHPLAEIEANMRYADKYIKGKTNPAGWLIHCIENDLAGKTKEKPAAPPADADKGYAQTDLEVDALLEEDAQQNDSAGLGSLTISKIKSELKENGTLSKIMAVKLKSVGMTVDDFKKKYM